MFAIAQAGSALQTIQTSGVLATLSLPSGVTINASVRGHFVTFNRQILFLTAGSINLWIDPTDFTVRPMGILPPIAAPTLAAGSGTGLTGKYRGEVAFYVKNAAGDVINLSPLSGVSLQTASLANKDLAWSNIPVSPDSTVTGRRLYRTASGGTLLFELRDLDDNVTTDILDATSDALLSDLPAAPTLGLAPGSIPGTAIALVTEWKNRLWAVSLKAEDRDKLIYTELDQFYGWNPENEIPVPPPGADAFGVTGFLRRRDFLGVARRDRLLKVIGSSPDDFELITVAEGGAGCVAPDTCVVIRDTAYYLGLDGVYQWNDDGAVCISRDAVDPWFTTDDYFNRSRFEQAFASWNPLTNAYELHLAAAGSSTEDRWVAFHLDQKEWLGPNKTAACTPSIAALLEAASDAYLPIIGASDGFLYMENQTVPSDIPGGGAAQAIDAFLQTRFHYDKAPDVNHFWGNLSVLGRIETGGSLIITPTVGDLGTSAGATLTHDLTLDREKLAILGDGRLCTLKFSLAVAGRRFLLHGYEIKPVFENGVR